MLDIVEDILRENSDGMSPLDIAGKEKSRESANHIIDFLYKHKHVINEFFTPEPLADSIKKNSVGTQNSDTENYQMPYTIKYLKRKDLTEI